MDHPSFNPAEHLPVKLLEDGFVDFNDGITSLHQNQFSRLEWFDRSYCDTGTQLSHVAMRQINSGARFRDQTTRA